MIRGFLNLPWLFWAALALIVGVIYSFVWPHKAVTATTGFRFLVLRWGHALTWILLSVNFLRVDSPPPSTARRTLSLSQAD